MTKQVECFQCTQLVPAAEIVMKRSGRKYCATCVNEAVKFTNEVEAAKRFVRVGNGMVIELRNQDELDHLFYHLWDKFDVEHLGAETDDENSWGYVSHYFYSREQWPAYNYRMELLLGAGKQPHLMELGADYMIQVVNPKGGN